MHFSTVIFALSSLAALSVAAPSPADPLHLDGPFGVAHLPDRDHRRIRTTRTTFQTSVVKKTSIPLPDITGVTHGIVGKIPRDVNCDKCGKHTLSSKVPTTLSTRLVTRGVNCDECGKHPLYGAPSTRKTLVTRGAEGADCSICGPKCTMNAMPTQSSSPSSTLTPSLEARSYSIHSIPTAVAPSMSVGPMVSGFGKRQEAAATVTGAGSEESESPREGEREQEEATEYEEEEEMGDD